MLISLISVKGAASFLGPSGVGELRQYQAVLGFVGALSGLGLGPSAVRSIAHFLAVGDQPSAARVAGILGRLSILTGLLGWVALVVACVPLGHLAFDDSEHAVGLALSGAAVFFGSVTAAYLALLQSRQRVGHVAMARIASSALTAVVSIACFWWLGSGGIVLALVASAAGTLIVHRRMVKGDSLVGTRCPPMAEVLRTGLGMAGLGIAMMAPPILACATGTITGGLIVRELGMSSNGLYSAAWGMSMLFAGFILAAMESDYFPRLSAVQSDPVSMKRVVNEQTEVGILLAMPGVIGTIVLGPLGLRVLYSQDFVPAADLLSWLVIGVFGRVVSWPVALILLARGRSRVYLVNEVIFAGLQLVLCAAGVYSLGLAGVAIAYGVQMWLYTLVMLVLAHREIKMRWSKSVIRLMAATATLVVCQLAVSRIAGEQVGTFIGLALVLLAMVMSIRGLASRLGPRHRLVAPLLRWRAGVWLAGEAPNQ
jgi:antigen flippase